MKKYVDLVIEKTGWDMNKTYEVKIIYYLSIYLSFYIYIYFITILELC